MTFGKFGVKFGLEVLDDEALDDVNDVLADDVEAYCRLWLVGDILLDGVVV